MLIDKHLNFTPSLAWELYETKGKNWLTSGWSLDAVTTPDRGGLGVAKDVYKSKLLEIDVGGYVNQGYKSFWKGELDLNTGVGFHIGF